MGMYTELHLNVELNKDIPEEVIVVLGEMTGSLFKNFSNPPNHKFFTLSRSIYMLNCDSFYFAADSNSFLRYDAKNEDYYLNIKCNLKNYEDEIELFLDWLNPYIYAEEGSFLGFSRYEETQIPTLIYKQ